MPQASRCRRLVRLAALSAAATLTAALPAGAEVKLPSIFGDHMVLQRGAPPVFFGTAEPGEEVTVAIVGQRAPVEARATADKDGRWRLELAPPAGEAGPFTVLVGSDRTAEPTEFSDVLVGEVWLAGGQSNMEWPVRSSRNGPVEVAAADFPQIRVFNAAKTPALAPAGDVTGRWQVVTPQTVGGFSAVGFFFGREIHKALDVPVGLIGSNWGGTPVEAWMSADALAAAGFPDAAAAGRRNLEQHGVVPQVLMAEDTGITKPHWAAPDLSPAGWKDVQLPGAFDRAGPEVDGAAWFRRSVAVPEAMAGKPLVLSLGPIDDFDVAWFNGTEVGRTGPETESAQQVARRYEVPGELVKAGNNVIAVRVFDRGGAGGFTGQPPALSLAPAEGSEAAGEAIPLAGTWRSAFERAVVQDADEAARLAALPRPQNQAGALYDGMIAPIAPYAVRGFLWYQGESNTGRSDSYDEMLRAMIAQWREAFAGPDETPQPFLIVQLANFQRRNADPAYSDGWAQLREAQRQVAKDPGNGLAVTVDIGEAEDIHPRNKLDVGKRLALVALRDVYGQQVVAGGPSVASAVARGGEVVLTFDNAEGLELRGDASQAFAVGDAEGNWAWATPRVEGQTVVLESEAVAEPTTVRYAWQINPPSPLYNAAGLPASPFRAEIDR